MSEISYVKSNIIIENKREDDNPTIISVRNVTYMSELLDGLCLRDSFRIKGIGMLGIRAIRTLPISGVIEFICYPVDTKEYF